VLIPPHPSAPAPALRRSSRLFLPTDYNIHPPLRGLGVGRQTQETTAPSACASDASDASDASHPAAQNHPRCVQIHDTHPPSLCCARTARPYSSRPRRSAGEPPQSSLCEIGCALEAAGGSPLPATRPRPGAYTGGSSPSMWASSQSACCMPSSRAGPPVVVTLRLTCSGLLRQRAL
jgi:hypothetical protein